MTKVILQSEHIGDNFHCPPMVCVDIQIDNLQMVSVSKFELINICLYKLRTIIDSLVNMIFSFLTFPFSWGGDLDDHLMGTGSFTLIMKKIFMRALRITRKLATPLIWNS